MTNTSISSNNNLVKHHFVQPLMHDFLSNFSIPKAFLKHLRREDDVEDENYAILRDKRNEIWHVKLERENGKMYMKGGWEKFCKDHGLQIGDFLVFKYHGDFTFDVIIFDPSTCERHIIPPTPNVSSATTKPPINNKGKGVKKIKKVVKGAKEGFKPRGFPYFRTSVKSYCEGWSGLYIPAEFAEENNLRKRWCKMVVIDEKEKRWPLLLRHTKGGGSTYIGKWSRFQRSKGLKAGDPLIFELLRSSRNPIMKLYR